MSMINSIIKSTGDKINNDTLLPVFVQGAWNLGPIYERKEVETAGFHPGMGVDPTTTAADMEDHVTISANASVRIIGIAEIDYGMMLNCSVAYETGDDAKIIYFHWNPGALLRNIPCVDPAAHIEPGELIGTTSTVPGTFKDDTTTGVCLRAYKYFADAAGALDIVAFIHGYL